MKNPKVAALLSLIFPGLGQFYIRHYVDGVVFLAGTGVLWFVIFYRRSYLMTFDNVNSYLVWGALVFIYLYSMANAYFKSKRT